MQFEVGQRVMVPGAEGVQGLVTYRKIKANADSMWDRVQIRYVADVASVVETDFDAADVEQANPPPVDIDSLRRTLNDAVALGDFLRSERDGARRERDALVDKIAELHKRHRANSRKRKSKR